MQIWISLSGQVPKRKLVLKRSRDMLVHAEKTRQINLKEAGSTRDPKAKAAAMKAAAGSNKKIERLRSVVRINQAKVSMAQQLDMLDNQIEKAKAQSDTQRVKLLQEQRKKLDTRMKEMKPIARPKSGRKMARVWRYPANT